MCAYSAKPNDHGLYDPIESYCLFSLKARYQRSLRTEWGTIAGVHKLAHAVSYRDFMERNLGMELSKERRL